MRKYFLLSAVALLAATNVNAGVHGDGAGGVFGHASFTANAELEYSAELNCTSLEFGKIVLKNDSTQDSTVTITRPDEDVNYTGDITEISGTTSPSTCQIPSGYTLAMDAVQLKHESSDNELGLSLSWYNPYVGGTLTIPANSPAGKYTTNITLTITY